MVTATISPAPTKLFLQRWVKQLIPELVKMNAVTESGVQVITHWMEATVAELEGSLYGKMPSVESAPRVSPQLAPVQKAASDDGPWSPERVIDELLHNHQVTHVVFGANTSARGHRVQGVKGLGDSTVVRYANSEKHHRALFMDNWDGYFQATFNKVLFQARLTSAMRFGETQALKLAFNDNTGDSRDGSHTDYTVGYPFALAGKVLPAVYKNPEILIIVFQRIFPEMDRTRGELKMDSDWKKHYAKFSEYDQANLFDKLPDWR